MTQFFLVTLALAIVSIVAARQLAFLLLFALTLRVFIPPIAVSEVFGGGEVLGLSFHPASLLIMFSLLSQLAVSTKPLGQSVRPFAARGFILLILGAVGVVVTINVAEFSKLPGMVSTVIVPVIFFVLVLHARAIDPQNTTRIALGILGLGVVQSAIAVAQAILQSDIFWSTARASAGRSNFSAEYTRVVGTMDNAIELGIFLAACVTLLPILARRYVQFFSLFLLIAATLLTESRVAAVSVVVASLYFLFARKTRSRTNFLTTLATAGFAMSAIALFSRPVIERMLSLNTRDDGRIPAWEYFWDAAPSFFWIGGGYSTGSAVKGTILATSLENGYAIWAMDFGVAAAIVYLAIQLSIVAKSMIIKSRYWPGALIMIVGAFSFSSFGNPSSYGLLLWAFLGISANVIANSDDPVRGESSSSRHRSLPIRV